MKPILYVTLSLLGLVSACQPQQTLPVSTPDGARLAVSNAFAARQQLGTVSDASLDEISGLVESPTNPGYLWVQEDSGNPNKVYLIDTKGNTKATITLPVSNRDWEDIAVGPGPKLNTSYVYVADVGNNDLKNDKVYIYRFEEPTIPTGSMPYSKTLRDSEVQKLDFAYADGPHNCETLMIDSTTKDFYFITKEDNGKNQVPNAVKGGVYRAQSPKESGTNTLTRQGGTNGGLNILTATGGDISANGQEVLIKNYTTVYYWKKTSASQSMADLLKTAPVTLNYTEEPAPGAEGGEAIGWKKDGSGYFTISEFKNNIRPAIYFYKRQIR